MLFLYGWHKVSPFDISSFVGICGVDSAAALGDEKFTTWHSDAPGETLCH